MLTSRCITAFKCLTVRRTRTRHPSTHSLLFFVLKQITYDINEVNISLFILRNLRLLPYSQCTCYPDLKSYRLVFEQIDFLGQPTMPVNFDHRACNRPEINVCDFRSERIVLLSKFIFCRTWVRPHMYTNFF